MWENKSKRFASNGECMWVYTHSMSFVKPFFILLGNLINLIASFISEALTGFSLSGLLLH